MNLASRKYIPHTIIAASVGAVVIAIAAPSEQRLGDTVKLIYLHASITWVSLAAFSAAAVIGVAALALRSEKLASWSVATLATATVFWALHFSLGLITMKLAWGDWFWSEPRIRAGMLILGVSIAATLLSISIEKTWAGPLLSVGVVVFSLLLLSTVGRVFHPTAAIRDSDSLAIKGAVFLIVLLVAFTSVQVTRLFVAIRAPAPKSSG